MKEKPLRPITVISMKYDGTIRETYTGHLLEQVGPMIRVQVSAGTSIYKGTDRPATVTDNGIELYFTDRWYNVWHFLEHGINRYLWYSNIATPAKLEGTTLQWIDLDIDVCCHLDGSIKTLDYDEFQEHRFKMNYPNDLVERALAAHDDVIQLSETGAFPFDRNAQMRHWIDTLIDPNKNWMMTERNVPSNDAEMLSYYERFDEADRLARGTGLLEVARMQELIQRFLPSTPAVVIDAGGGPGRYSCWLAEKGHEVHLVDPVAKHVSQAREASDLQPTHPLASVTQGDARSLNHDDCVADVVLLMGPLYHLTNREHRLAALREASRVLKPGGLLFANAINRFASLLDGLRKGFIDDPCFVSIVHRDLEEGQHRGQLDALGYFTTAYFHLPEELEAEILEAGFYQQALYSVRGPGEFAKDLEGRMSDPEKRKQLLDLIRSVEQETTLLGMSSNFAIVATK